MFDVKSSLSCTWQGAAPLAHVRGWESQKQTRNVKINTLDCCYDSDQRILKYYLSGLRTRVSGSVILLVRKEARLAQSDGKNRRCTRSIGTFPHFDCSSPDFCGSSRSLLAKCVVFATVEIGDLHAYITVRPLAVTNRPVLAQSRDRRS